MQLRTLCAQDVDQAWQLDHECFHTDPDNKPRYARFFQPDRMIGIFEGDRLSAMAGVYAFAQFFGGRPVPMGGVSSMAVAPDQRGRGRARALLDAMLPAMAERGEVISSLYPATTALYRSVGYELAGNHVVRRVAPDVLKTLPRASRPRLRPGTADDFDAIARCYRRLAAATNGFVDYPELIWRRAREIPGRSVFVVDSEAVGEVDGYCIYGRFDGETTHMGGGPWGIRVDALLGADRETTLSLWNLLASWSSMASQIVYRGASEDPLLLLLPEQRTEVLAEVRWMTRIVDAAGAIAARGFSPAVRAEVDLELRDDELPANQGRFRLLVADGKGALEPGGDGAIALDARGLASLYTGWSNTTTLARAGRLSGGSDRQRSDLDAIFAGPMPWMPEEF